MFHSSGSTISLFRPGAEKKPSVAYTDGSASPNPGRGGWGYLIKRPDGSVTEASGGERETTNNRMELTAILMAMLALDDNAAIVIYSDSQYAVNGLTVWSKKWARLNWRKKSGSPMPNRDLWLELEVQKMRVRASFLWVRGHNGDRGNERADALANAGRLNSRP